MTRSVKIDERTYITLWAIRNEYVSEGKRPPSMRVLIGRAVIDCYSLSGTRPDDRSKTRDADHMKILDVLQADYPKRQKG